MENYYYTLPIKPMSLFGKNHRNYCGLKESIAHFIHLINTTHFGECRFDPSFGCAIWDVDFDNLKSTNSLKSQIAKSLNDSIIKHETRLENIKVGVSIKQEEIDSVLGTIRIKKRVDISVKGIVKKTNEPFSYIEYFYIGPLSY